MRKGLSTLLTVAIALVSSQAMAMAPTIFDIPSPIIGSGTGSSQSTKYVYPDAFDLTTLAADDNTAPADLKWSYEIVGAPKYVINGLSALNSSVDNAVTPPLAKDLNHALATAEIKDLDRKPSTITIRNHRLAPIAGGGATDTTAGFIDPQAVTFWVSDGTAVSSQTVNFITDNYANGWNRLQTVWKMEKADFLTKSWRTVDGPFGDCTTRTMENGTGICFYTQQLGNNMAAMSSPYGFFTLTANKVYRIRATMNGSQATAGKTPLWDFLIDNYNASYGNGLNAYGMDALYMDNEGGANAVLAKEGGSEYVMYWAPAAFRTAQWNAVGTVTAPTGIYSPSYSTDKDPYLRFRVMDVTNNPSLRSDQKFGALCLQKVFVESLPFSSIKVANKLVEIGTITGGTIPVKFKAATNTAPGGNVFIKGLVGTSVAYSSTGGYVTLTPNTANSQANELVAIQPAVDLKGINTNDGSVILTAPFTDILDDYPLPWTSNKMLMLEVDLSAPNPNSEAHPWDIIVLSMESVTNELMYESYVTATKKIATPRNNSTQQTYTMFFNTMNETKSNIANFHFLRWRVRFANSNKLNWPTASDKTNNGAVTVKRIAVSEVTFQ